MFNNKFLIDNKRGQISDTIMWFVATFVIILILGATIYVASVFGSTKYGGNNFFRGDRLIEKSIFAFLITPLNESGEILFQQLADGSQSDEVIQLAGENLFNQMYGNKYSVSFDVKNSEVTKFTYLEIIGTNVEYFVRGIEILPEKGVEVTLRNLI